MLICVYESEDMLRDLILRVARICVVGIGFFFDEQGIEAGEDGAWDDGEEMVRKANGQRVCG